MPDLEALPDEDSPEFEELAATCFQLVDRLDEPHKLAALLQGEDPIAVRLCERSLWSRWFGQAGAVAQRTLHEAMELMEEGRIDGAERLLDELIEHHPNFAEAYHQRGMAHTLCEDHVRAREDFLRAVELNPVHFAALANLGHCCVQLGRYRAAREWYLAALRIHPRLPGLRQMLRELNDLDLPAPRRPE